MRFSTRLYFASRRLLRHARKGAFCRPLPSPANITPRLENTDVTFDFKNMLTKSVICVTITVGNFAIIKKGEKTK